MYGACYHLLSDYERRMDSVDLETVAYQNACEAFAVGLHAVCHRPRLRTDDRPPPKCDFPGCLVSVEVPPQLSQHHIAVMALWLRWDPFTDRMTEFDVSKSPALDKRDLWRYSVDVWEERNEISRTLAEEKRRTEQRRWTTEMEEKLKVFSGVDPSQYPDDLKAYVDHLKGNDAPNELANEEDRVPDERKNSAVDTKFKTQKLAEVNPTPATPLAELKKTPSEEIEKRRTEQMETISNSLKYPEQLNELNPRRYVLCYLFKTMIV